MPGLLFLRSVQRGKRRAALAYCDYRQAATEHWNIAMRWCVRLGGEPVHKVDKNPTSRCCCRADVCSVHSACDRCRIHILTARGRAPVRPTHQRIKRSPMSPYAADEAGRRSATIADPSFSLTADFQATSPHRGGFR